MEAFADGVFAIALTLPVVDLVMPERGADHGQALFSQWPHYLGYSLAALVIGLYWVHHHFSGAIYRTTGHWFLVATLLFLTAIGFIAFPARVLAEHAIEAGERATAVRYWVGSLAGLSLTWLLKWTVGRTHGQVDARLEIEYVCRLDRRYRLFALANIAAALTSIWSWEAGLLLSSVMLLTLLIPPETPRYRTEAPIVEGESASGV
jgi:uncharacterized membrane protein